MAKNNRPQNQQEQKVVTKYDKKVQKRKEAQRQISVKAYMYYRI